MPVRRVENAGKSANNLLQPRTTFTLEKAHDRVENDPTSFNSHIMPKSEWGSQTDHTNWVEMELDADGNRIPDPETIFRLTPRQHEELKNPPAYHLKGREPTEELDDFLFTHRVQLPHHKPPKYHFGLGLSTEDMLAYVARHNITLTTEDFYNRVTPSRRHEIEIIDAKDAVARHLTHVLYTYVPPLDATHDCMIALYHNYDWYDRETSDADEAALFATLQTELRVPGPAKWYYDYEVPPLLNFESRSPPPPDPTRVVYAPRHEPIAHIPPALLIRPVPFAGIFQEKPPPMYFGLALDTADLEAYATRHGLAAREDAWVRQTRSRVQPYSDEERSLRLTHPATFVARFAQKYDLAVPDARTARLCWRHKTPLARHYPMALAVKRLSALTGMELYTEQLDTVTEHEWVLVLFNNYTWCDRNIEDEAVTRAVETLRRELGISRPAMWYDIPLRDEVD